MGSEMCIRDTYLRFGLADALIYGGSLLLLLALAAARAAKRSAGDKERGA